MKKAIIALAVAAGSIAAAQAADTTTLYGSIGFTSEFANGDTVGNTLKSIKDNNWDIATDRIRIGVKGSEDLGNGLEATFKIEGNNGLNAARDAYLGLKGGFGEVRFGRQGSTWGEVDEGYFRSSDPAQGVGVSDEEQEAFNAALEAAGEEPFDFSPVADSTGRESKTIKYISPDFSGIKVQARIQADGDNKETKGVDLWDTAVSYEANGFKAAAAYGVRYNEAFDNFETLGVQAGYSNDQFEVFANAQHLSHVNTSYNIQGQYKFDQSAIRAGFGYKDYNNDVNDFGLRDQFSVGLGYQYNLSKRTSTWVEGAYTNVDKGDDNFSASVGIRHDF